MLWGPKGMGLGRDLVGDIQGQESRLLGVMGGVSFGWSHLAGAVGHVKRNMRCKIGEGVWD